MSPVRAAHPAPGPLAALAALVVLIATLGACGDDDGDLAAFCERASGVEEIDFDGDVLSPGLAAEQLDQARSAYEPIRDVAPAEVSDDLEVLLEFVTDLRDDLRAVDPADPTGGFTATVALEERFDEVDEATAALSAFRRSECPAAAAG